MKTYLFIHGAWHGKWCWKKVLEILKEKNIKAYAIDLPGHGTKNSMKEVFLGDYVDYCVSYIKEKNLNDIVLVGHSFAGVVISRLAEEIPERISKLVYLAGIVLDNECFLDIIPKEIAKDFRNQAKKGSCLNLPEEAIHHLFLSSIDRKDIRFQLVLKNLTPQPAYPFFEKVFYNKAEIPKIYISCKRDNAVNEILVNKALSILKCEHIIMDSDHDAMISNPELLAEMIIKSTFSTSL